MKHSLAEKGCIIMATKHEVFFSANGNKAFVTCNGNIIANVYEYQSNQISVVSIRSRVIIDPNSKKLIISVAAEQS
jgi:hypothetical protein